ncbi:hypothetical protein NDU88_003411 [Pleurodeles waltl]|uniref:Uncharacterized protein n=1 Tax=Pleurodeles waltl TaxID=8319 RepID=A0AAV7RCT2_PLEWA|nr:hypothetical protein NDU88_003411 [Pleurodeles waltl]
MGPIGCGRARIRFCGAGGAGFFLPTPVVSTAPQQRLRRGRTSSQKGKSRCAPWPLEPPVARTLAGSGKKGNQTYCFEVVGGESGDNNVSCLHDAATRHASAPTSRTVDNPHLRHKTVCPLSPTHISLFLTRVPTARSKLLSTARLTSKEAQPSEVTP